MSEIASSRLKLLLPQDQESNCVVQDLHLALFI